jgi:hypothetical protein
MIAALSVAGIAVGRSSRRALREVQNYCEARLAGLKAYEQAFARVRRQLDDRGGDKHGTA